MPAPGATLPKDPESDLDYTVNWADWLQTSESIATSTWNVPAGLTSHDDSKTSNTATIFISGGTVNEIYTIENIIETNSSPARTAERSFKLAIVER